MGTPLYIPNTSSIPTVSFASGEKLHIVAKYPGALANSIIKISLATADDFATDEVLNGLTFA